MSARNKLFCHFRVGTHNYRFKGEKVGRDGRPFHVIGTCFAIFGRAEQNALQNPPPL